MRAPVFTHDDPFLASSQGSATRRRATSAYTDSDTRVCVSPLCQGCLIQMAGCLWVLPTVVASGATDSGTPPAYQRPLCKALESYDSDVIWQSMPTKFVCRDDGDGSACTASGIGQRELFPKPCGGDQAVGDEETDIIRGHFRTFPTASKSNPKRILRPNARRYWSVVKSSAFQGRCQCSWLHTSF